VKGIEVPDRTEDFTADPVELFFDLAYVFAFSQLVGFLFHDPTWSGAGKAALLFALLWLPWQELTWSANAVSGNGRPIRLLFLVATVISVPMAASTSTATGAGGPVFAIALAAIMVLGFSIQRLSTTRGTGLHRAVVRWIAPNVAAIVVLLAGALVHGTARIALWVVSVGIVLLAMIIAGQGEWVIRSGHMAERHGLIVIIALGEVVVAVGLPVFDSLSGEEGLPARSVLALLASGAFACLLWWGYFDRPGPALEHRAEGLATDVERGRYVRDVYTWAHAPIVAGIVLAAAALEQIALHPTEPIEGGFRLMLVGGMAMILGGVAAAVWRAFHAVARERIVGVAAVAVVVAVTSRIDGVVVLLVVVTVMFVTLLVEHQRIER
jgi:low temperature requirement protein LtrA